MGKGKKTQAKIVKDVNARILSTLRDFNNKCQRLNSDSRFQKQVDVPFYPGIPVNPLIYGPLGQKRDPYPYQGKRGQPVNRFNYGASANPPTEMVEVKWIVHWRPRVMSFIQSIAEYDETDHNSSTDESESDSDSESNI